jgi:hypothetical protein
VDTQILSATWSDTFSDAGKIATSTNVEISGGDAMLSGGPDEHALSGTLGSVPIGSQTLYRWKTFTASINKPAGTDVLFSFYDAADTSLIPDSMIGGNSAGIASTSVNLSLVSTSTYKALHIHSLFSTSDASTTPSIDSYSIDYDYGPDPVPNVGFSMQGLKTIGTGPSSNPVYKYAQGLNTGASASLVIPNLEWDVYTINVDGDATGYDIASSCPAPQPETFPAGSTATTNLYLTPHTSNSLLVNVRSVATGALIPDSTVGLTLNPSYAATSTADSCGQTFFGGLSASASYILSVSAVGYQTATSTINVSGATQMAVTLN